MECVCSAGEVGPGSGDGTSKSGPVGGPNFGCPADGGIIVDVFGIAVAKVSGFGDTIVGGIGIIRVVGGRFLVGGLGVCKSLPDFVDMLCAVSLCVFKYELSSFWFIVS